MDDMLIMHYFAAHSRSKSRSFPGSRFGFYRGASVTGSSTVLAQRSRIGVISDSSMGLRRSSWAWGHPVRSPSPFFDAFAMSRRHYDAIYRPKSFVSVQIHT
jgi:hypothetical protein